jgi:plasmid maintenance system antidote protein VapI
MQTGRERLRQWITRSKLQQNEAAAVIGMHPTQLNHILTGDRRPGLDTAVKIERATGIVVEAWVPFGDDDLAEPHPEPVDKSQTAKA